jgi:predicted alpha/beta-hydrolase family hydrolase
MTAFLFDGPEDAATTLLLAHGAGAAMDSPALTAAAAAFARAGLLCLGYPFHPPARPDQLRTAHLEILKTPALIAQGTRDPFGTRDEVETYRLSPAIRLLWLEDGDHDLRPRKAVSGLTAADHLGTLAGTAADWAARLPG